MHELVGVVGVAAELSGVLAQHVVVLECLCGIFVIFLVCSFAV